MIHSIRNKNDEILTMHWVKEPPKETPKETPKEIPKETPKETAKVGGCVAFRPFFAVTGDHSRE